MIATTGFRRFRTGFLIAVAVFAATTALDAQLRSDCGLLGLFKLASCNDDISRAGFPRQFYEEGGFGYHRDFSPLYLGCDIAIGLAISLMGGFVAQRPMRSRQ